MLANYSIRSKIITVIVFLLAAMTGMGLLTVRNMRAINANMVDISTVWLPSVRVLGDLRYSVALNRTLVHEHLLAETFEDKLRVEKVFAANLETIARIRREYEPLATSPDERALYDEWSKTWDEFQKG